MSKKSDSNVVGALTFYLYIVAALLLTGSICRDLLGEYYSKPSRTKKKAKSEVKDGSRQETFFQISVLAVLSTLSFAMLSYHMLSFLILSYQTWAPSHFPEDVSLSSVWIWSTNTQLFHDFAETISDDPCRFWWTQLALTYSFGWNVYMTIEGILCPFIHTYSYASTDSTRHPGSRNNIPHLWTYFLLDQILPISFTQNLFMLAVLLKDEAQVKRRKVEPAKVSLQILLVLAYFTILSMAPSSVGRPRLFVVLLSTRALLFAPFVVLQPQLSKRMPPSSPRQGAASKSTSSQTSAASYIRQHEARWALALTVGYAMMQLIVGLTMIPSSIKSILFTLHDNPAVSALGYDFLIGMFSLSVSVAMR